MSKAILKTLFQKLSSSGKNVKKWVTPVSDDILEGIRNGTKKSPLTPEKTADIARKVEALDDSVFDSSFGNVKDTIMKEIRARKFSIEKMLKEPDEKSLANVRKVMNNMGISDADFDKAFAIDGHRGLVGLYSKKISNDILREGLKTQTEMAKGLIDENTLQSILANDEMPAIMKMNKLHTHRIAVMDNIQKEIGFEGGPNIISRGITSLPTKISRAAYEYYDKGYNWVGDQMKALHSLLRGKRYLDDVLANYNGTMKNAWSNLKKTGKHDAVREYIEVLDPMKMTKMGGGASKKMIEIDPEALKAVSEKFKVNLGYDDLRVANRTINMYRSLAKANMEVNNGKYDFMSLISSADDIPDDIIQFKTNFGYRDAGVNYFHAVPTKEYYSNVIVKNEELQKVLPSILDDEYKRASLFTKMRREGVSGLRLDHTNRLSPDEEISHYLASFSKINVKGTGDRLISQAYMAFAMPQGRNPMNRKDIQHLGVVKDYWDMKMNPAKYYGERSLTESIAENAKKGFGATVVNSAEILADNYAKWALPMMLNPITGWRATAWNLAQLPIVAGSYKGYVNTILKTAKATSGFARDVLANEGNMQKTFESMASRKKGLDKELFEQFLKRNPMSYSINASQDMLADKGTATRSITDMISYTFRGSDKITRFAGFGAAVNHATPAYEQFIVDIRKGMPKDKALGALAKRVHIREFDKIDAAEILDTINLKDPSKTMKEFLYKYAESSTFVELFDYTAVGAPGVKDFLGSISPVFPKAIAFRTWPLLYNQLISNSIESYKHGDKKPLIQLVVAGITMYTALDIAQSKTEEDSQLRKFFETGVSRAPLTSYISMANMANEPVFGVMTPVASAPLWLLTEALTEWGELWRESGEDPSYLEYTRRLAKRNTTASIFYKLTNDTLKLWEDE